MSSLKTLSTIKETEKSVFHEKKRKIKKLFLRNTSKRKDVTSDTEKYIEATLLNSPSITITDYDKTVDEEQHAITEQFYKDSEQANRFLRQGDYASAFPLLQKIFIQDSSNIEVQYGIGFCYEKLKMFDEAETVFRNCSDFELSSFTKTLTAPSSQSNYNDRDYTVKYVTFLLNNDKFSIKSDEAIKRLKFAAVQMNNVSAMYNLGKILINGMYNVQEDFEEGQEYLKKAYAGGQADRAWAVYEKRAKKLEKQGKLDKIPDRETWAKLYRE
ncbi:12855_t:CDS:2 [Dentiscutata erythropus]|uniref:12855_t:CDS:1 n=1 Tax=Dentiscutata erythropus TaxID=1348616 RepID=A0A9N8VD10_9GLOM|nr:12855_t:CDS:2 [Dentiscutata erythropus]